MGVRFMREEKDRYLVGADEYIFCELGARLLSMSLLVIFARLLTASLVDDLLRKRDESSGQGVWLAGSINHPTQECATWNDDLRSMQELSN